MDLLLMSKNPATSKDMKRERERDICVTDYSVCLVCFGSGNLDVS